MINLHNYKKSMDNDGIIFSFSGPMSHEIISGIGNSVRERISAGDAGDKKTALTVFSIFVEQVENVIHYSIEKDPIDSSKSFGIVVVGKKQGKYFISGGNRISKEKQTQLDEYLSKLAKMNKDELKAFYKEKRRASRKADSDSKGGGIGFIEMARKASEPLSFDFQEINDKETFFTINICI